MQTSLYKSGDASKHSTKTTTIEEVIRLIRKEWADVIEKLRNGDDEAYTANKRKLPAFTPSAVFPGTRGKYHDFKHSGIMSADVDQGHISLSKVEDIHEAIRFLTSDEHCVFAFISPSGEGVKAGFRLAGTIEDHIDHKRAYRAVKDYLGTKGIVIDRSCSDVSRLCFMSHDPKAYYNANATPMAWEHITRGTVIEAENDGGAWEGEPDFSVIQALLDEPLPVLAEGYDYGDDASSYKHSSPDRDRRAEAFQTALERIYPDAATYKWMGQLIEYGDKMDPAIHAPEDPSMRSNWVFGLATTWYRIGGTPETLMGLFETDDIEITSTFFRDWTDGPVSMGGPRDPANEDRQRRRTIERALIEVAKEEKLNAVMDSVEPGMLYQKYEAKYEDSRDKWEKLLSVLESPRHKRKPVGVAKDLARMGIDEGLIAQTLGMYFPDEQLGKLAYLTKKVLAELEQERLNAMDDLAFMNEKHFRVRFYGSSSPVVTVKEDGSLVFQNHRTFEQAYSSNQVLGHDGKNFVSKAKWWLEHPKCRTYDEVIFDPEKPPETATTYNLWRGFLYEPKEGEIPLTEGYLRDVLCSGDTEALDYLWKWMAHVVQKPGKPAGVALVLRSNEEGTGKSFFAEKVCGALVGDNYREVEEPFSKFNSDQQGAVVMFCDELVCTGSKREESALKIMLTAGKRQFERKGFDKVSQPNHLHMIIASNNDWVVPAHGTARRFFVLDISAERVNDFKYFGAIIEELENGGYEALMHKLLTVKLTEQKDNLDPPPMTTGLTRQKEESLNCLQSWWYEFLQAGNPGKGWVDFFETAALYNLYRVFHEDYGGREKLVGDRKFGTRLREMCPDAKRTRSPNVNEEKKRPWGYSLPPLDECRKAWEKSLGMKPTWDEPLDDSPF